MMTIVDESGRTPLAVVRGGSPRNGDLLWLNNSPYKVLKRNGDVLVVRRRGFAGNPPEDPSYRKNFPLPRPEDELRTYKRTAKAAAPKPQAGTNITGGPFRDPNTGRVWFQTDKGPYFLPESPPLQPYYAPGGTYEGDPSFQTREYKVYHADLRIPIFKLETSYIPKAGTKEYYGGELFEFLGGEANVIWVRPVDKWRYFAVALDRDTNKAILFKAYHHSKDMKRAKDWLRQRMVERGVARKKYRLTHVDPVRMMTFFENPSHLPVYRRMAE